jgi:hypothetical protein
MSVVNLTAGERRVIGLRTKFPGRKVHNVMHYLPIVLNAAETLHKAGFRYVKLGGGTEGFFLITKYRGREIRFQLVPENETDLSGMMMIKAERIRGIGAILVAEDRVTLISDTLESVPSGSMKLRRIHG